MMPSTRLTRSSVLGKRPHQSEQHACPTLSDSQQVATPDPTPKRSRTSLCIFDGDGNKENVPPLRIEPIVSPTISTRRTLRRASSESETPTRPRIAIRRTASITTTSSNAESPSDTLPFTFTPPSSPSRVVLPIQKRVRALLRATCDGSLQMAGRDKERDVINAFISSFDGDDVPTTLYISGSPGTGKTALVNSCLGALESSGVKIISINCMALKCVDALWERVLEELGGSKAKTRGRGKDAVERVLSTLKTKCVLVLDELDHIAASASSLVSMLSLPKAASATLRVVGIANTHTLTSSLSQSGEAILPFVKTLHFPPYTASQLLDVLNARLAPVYNGEDKNETKSFLPLPALSLLTKKVASTTGDVRALFEVLRGAIDKAVSTSDFSAGETDSNTPIASTPIVTPAHILAAYKVYAPSVASTKGGAVGSNSEVVTKVKNLGLQARLVFLSLLLASQRLQSGLSLSTSPPPTPTKSGSAKSTSSMSSQQNGTGIDATLLHVYYTSLLSRSEGGLFKPVGQSEFRDLLSMLEVVGLASSAGCSASTSPVKGGKRAFSRSASFGGSKAQGQGQVVRLVADIRVEEALRGLGVGSGIEPADVKEEEVKSIWERESARSAREVKGKAAKAKTPQHADVLGGAVEDL